MHLTINRRKWMIRAMYLLPAITFLAIALMTTPVLAISADIGGSDDEDFTFFPTPTAWDPGPNTARIGGFPAPGGATWSAMPSGITFSAFAAFETIPGGGSHPAGDLSVDIEFLVTGAVDGLEYGLFNSAFNVWAAAGAITNLGKVVDSGALAGSNESAGGHIGDIRAAGYQFGAAPTPFGVLAHAYQPGTETLFGGPGFGNTITGDVHFDTAESWSDDPTDTTGDADFDFFTVALHEIGHALGLGHSAVVGSVMEPIYAGARRTLHADDIAGIRAIYGVPEPGSFLLAVLGFVGLAVMARRRRAS